MRLFLCDDTEPVRALMSAALPDAHLEVVGQAGDGFAGVAGVVETQADAILLDLAMPGWDGMTAIPVIRERAPGCAIVVFSGFEARRMERRCLELGADGYVEKGAEIADIRAAVHRAVAGQRGSTASGVWS